MSEIPDEEMEVLRVLMRWFGRRPIYRFLWWRVKNHD